MFLLVKIKVLEAVLNIFFWLYFERKKKFRKTTRLIRIKFVGKLCLVFIDKNKSVRGHFLKKFSGCTLEEEFNLVHKKLICYNYVTALDK